MGGMDFFFLEAHALIRDHPCLRGEYVTGWLVLKYPTGSLPLTRGIQVSGYQIGSESRITPAYAGNTGIDSVLTCLTEDHPRLRGEYDGGPLPRTCDIGSPPLTRGIPRVPYSESIPFGITPAYAGNTLSAISFFELVRDHPRLRGEYRHN